MEIRPPAVAGSFYPAEAQELRETLAECFGSSSLGPLGSRSPLPSLIGGMVPHAGYRYSGACAAHLYARLDPSVDRVFILGVNHRAMGYKAALSPWDYWQTPLGEVAIDQELSEWLQRRVPFLKKDVLAHSSEHSIEVQLPFLQSVLTAFTFLPISLSYLTLAECAALGRAVAETCLSQASRPVILASSDLHHYGSPTETEKLDELALEKVLARNPRELIEVVEEHEISMCGVIPTAVVLFAVNALGVTQAHLLKHCHSGDTAPMREVVGYASAVFEL
ncbi:MAG TPA: AmmeMemoRadiSam system protein B [Candidatus Binatia bacterium]|nr:AmmeMemoRadiSam system protein B [Candidatus Binatia bacterium]